MAKFLSFVLIVFAALPAQAQEAAVMTAEEPAETTETVEPAVPELEIYDASEVSLEQFLWLKRPVVVFADTPADPRYVEQINLLTARPDALMARDVVVITDTDPAGRSSVRMALRPRGFQLTLVAKDGRVNLRKPLPWDVREITRAIDKWPLRQEEIRRGKETTP